MTTTTDSPVAPPAGPRYYRSFASYEIPFRPDDPVAFADTEGLRSFYVAYHDPAGRVVRFDKLRLVRAERVPREFGLPTAEEPGSVIYFEAVHDPATRDLRLGERLPYRETEPLDEFFAAQVDPSGRACRATLFRKEIAFSDAYEYWPTGRLQKRTMTGPDRPKSVAHYDRDGRPVADPAPEPASAEGPATERFDS